MSAPTPLSRRQFLRVTGFGAAGLALAACAAPVQPSAAPQAESGQQSQDVYITTLAAFADMGQRDSTDLFNEEVAADGIHYVLEESPEGWETKALAMIRDDDVRWSANGIANAGNQWNYIQMGMVQPLDELLQTSRVAWGADMSEQFMYSNIYEATQYDGQTYFVPMKLNIHLMGYRQDFIEQAGYEAIPETWDEFELLLGAMAEALAEEEVVPFAVRKEVFRTIGTMFTTFVEQPYHENGMLKIDSEEWLQMIKMINGWFEQGLTNLEVMQDPVTDWQRGKVGIGIDSHSWIRLGRSVWGDELVNGTVPPKTDASNSKRTWVHLDSGFVFTGAPDPQAGTDWLLAVHGPDGAPADNYWAGTLTFSGMPVHQSQYDRLIGNVDGFPELKEAYEAVPNSVLQPLEAGRYYPIIQAKIWPWLERYWGGEVSAEVAMENVIEEVDAELDKQIS